MYQDKDTGAFIFQGDEEDISELYMWSCFVNMSLWHRVKFAIFVILLRIPKWVGYKPPDYYREKSFNILNKMAGR